MAKKIFITRRIPENGVDMLRQEGYDVVVSDEDRPLSKVELKDKLVEGGYDGVISLLTDVVDGEVMDVAPTVKIFANYAIGFNNFDFEGAKKRDVVLTNTPGGGADRVAEHTWALILALTCRVVEADKFVREGKYVGWDPMIFHGTKLSGKTLGIIGTGRIGADVVHRALHGFNMKVVYFDIIRNKDLEDKYGAVFTETPEEVLKISDIVSVHVPLTPQTRHLINGERLKLMKPTAFLVNTARGPIVDEKALYGALKSGVIAGAGLDVFEDEPKLYPGLSTLPNVVLTPHIASATKEAREEMSAIAAQNIIAFFETGKPLNPVV